MTTPAVECRDVTRVFPGGVTALQGVSISAHPGDFMAVLGPSGSGKTTLLHLMGTLDSPTTGSVLLEGKDVSSLRDRELSRLRADRIGFVFQQFHLSPLMNVRDNVADGLLYAGVHRKRRQLLAEEALEKVGLSHRLGHRPHALSGGERQRVAIARAVIGSPAVLLADEPTGNLDTANSQAVVDILRQLTLDGTAVVVITHDHEVAAGVDTQVVVRDGRVVRDELPTQREAPSCG